MREIVLQEIVDETSRVRFSADFSVARGRHGRQLIDEQQLNKKRKGFGPVLGPRNEQSWISS